MKPNLEAPLVVVGIVGVGTFKADTFAEQIVRRCRLCFTFLGQVFLVPRLM